MRKLIFVLISLLLVIQLSSAQSASLSPTSIAFGSFAIGGVVLALKRLIAEDGVTVYETPGPGVSTLTLSSTARDSIAYVPGAGAVKL